MKYENYEPLFINIVMAYKITKVIMIVKMKNKYKNLVLIFTITSV